MAVTVREYGFLTCAGSPSGLDRQTISTLDFEFLKASAIQPEPSIRLLRLTTQSGHEAVQVQNYVGVLSLPSGEQLEIVPKTTFGPEPVQNARATLLKMLSTIWHLRSREVGFASLQTLKRSWIEVLIAQMLEMIAKVARAGLRKNYHRVQGEMSFLRGQLKVVEQIRQRPGRQHKFHVSFDKYLTNRPENRLLRSTLEQLTRWSKDPANQRLCRELLFVLHDVPASANVVDDLRRWSKTRDMAMYAPLLPWVQLVLTNQSPIFSEGKWEGMSLLFPMEQLFEAYVAAVLENHLPQPYRLKTQARSEYLVRHRDSPWFQLRPDIVLVDRSTPVSILDTKWKLIDSTLADSSNKYGLSESDFYQLFAYGEKYLNGVGELFLIYPMNRSFRFPLDPFEFSNTLKLWAVPFNLHSDRIEWPTDCTLSYVDRPTGEETPQNKRIAFS